jgi:hypothetical protein
MNRTLSACVLMVVSTAFADDKKPEPKGEPVSGKITYKDQPLSGVVITFVSKDGKVAIAAPTGDDGTYAAKVPAGEYRITVTAAPAKKADPKDPPKKVVPVPVKYGDPKTTPLTCEVKAGEKTGQTIDIVLRD